MMPREVEISLAKSAAPASIFDHATIKVFTATRGFTGAPTFTPVEFRTMAAYDPKFLAPICLTHTSRKLFCRTTNFGPNWPSSERLLRRSPKPYRRLTRKETFPNVTVSVSLTCGPPIRRRDLEDTGIAHHGLCPP